MSLSPHARSEAERRYQPLQQGARLRLVHCRCRAGRGERVADEEHQSFSITLVDRGQFGYRTRMGHARLSAGWLMLGNAGEGYACSHDDSDGSGDDCTVLSLSPSLLDEALDALGTAGAQSRFEHACLPPIPRVASLFHGVDRGFADGFAVEEAALAIVAEVCRASMHGEAPAAVARQDERARAAAHYIETRCAEPLHLEDVARAATLSPLHLLRVFHQSIGVTPHQYLMRMRLMLALRLLRDTKLSVTDIAYESGWADLSNFNKAFRREFGCSPRTLRSTRLHRSR